ncbi:hypothetical protein DCO58_08595 [Helicobacter saguini]|uniref:Uncharacterized protein n=1 Tax=Helicobacter saguini TaxID=1548018 RepID=A0A347VXI7_9HELI|nr:hypothetical protein [Helicobacter saguini]MWV61618.1 hypothetical protein [Helicobacter saguini]MWV67710.1 hypothetical protein [Helicobacter saguini]MWV70062.1 hypothetical protein [Helicobacter saguini]MWV72725.1 hypothetical protein [Helicobacter saguini]TLD92012.1 hypothetical protein LS64_010905 [Helicobacter saguini]
MDDKNLKDIGNAALLQKHQMDSAENKIAEINLKIKEIESAQSDFDKRMENMDSMLENALASMDTMLDSINSKLDIESISQDSIKNYEEQIYKQLDSIKVEPTKQISTLETLDSIDFNGSWEEYLESMNAYANKHNIDLKQDPFKNLMSKSQEIELRKWIEQDFTYKNAKCDIYDYMIAVTCGAIGGIIDVCFVGIPGDSKLGNITDSFANSVTEKFAQLCGWDKEKALARGSDTTKSAIGFLESKFKINYDQTTTNGKKGTDGKIKNLSMKNHHLKSLGHSPDIIGLFFSILNQFTSTSSFINEGQIITIDTESFELQGGNFIAKIISGFINWLGHLMSDWAGSSGGISRGSGIPMPFYNLFQLCDFGSFGKDRQTFAVVTTKVFEQGYDFRHALAMAIPVAVSEILVRIMFVLKSRFYHRKEWSECKPNENIPEMRRMLCVAHGSLCLIDGIDAGVRSGGNAIAFLARINLLGFARFSHLALKEVKAWYLSGQMDIEKVDSYLDNEFKAMQMSLKY